MAKDKMKTNNQELKRQKREAKHKVRQTIKTIFVLLLVLLMVGVAIAPVFAQDIEGDRVPLSTNVNLAQTFIVNGASDTSTENVDIRIEEFINYIEDNYYKDVDEDALIEGAYRGILETLDPHSNYFTQDEFDDFMSGLSGEFSGIGASITEKDGYIGIVAPIKGSPAEEAGIKAGDLIVEVNGESAKGWTTEKAVSVIRGEKGTKVMLGIKRGASSLLNIEVIRDVIIVKTVSYDVLEDGIGYIAVTQFGEKTNEEFDEAMAYMVNNDIKSLIVDVRNNPGGYLSSAIHLSDYFVENGKVIVKESLNNGKTKTFRASTEKVPMNVAVLVNSGSASASEIFSGSIQQTGGGIVIGTTTYGKGTVQTPYDMSYGGAIKLTIAEYLLNNDYHVDGNGIIPDIEVALPTLEDYNAYGQLVPLNEKESKYYGETSLNIYGIQQRLNLLGNTLTVDGVLGYNTQVALENFQKNQGIKVSGYLDNTTLNAISSEVERIYSGNSDIQLEKAINYFKNK